MDGSPDSLLLVSPGAGEPVFRKESYSAFRGTGLGPWLRSLGVEELVIAGLQTHLCVETTAREAFLEGYDVVVASDACAAPCREGRDLHALSLFGMSQSVARVFPCATLMEGP